MKKVAVLNVNLMYGHRNSFLNSNIVLETSTFLLLKLTPLFYRRFLILGYLVTNLNYHFGIETFWP